MSVCRVFQPFSVRAERPFSSPLPIPLCIVTNRLYIRSNLFKELPCRFVFESDGKSAIGFRWKLGVSCVSGMDFVICLKWMPLVQFMRFFDVLASARSLAKAYKN